MPIVTTNSINLSVENATRYINDIKRDTRILSFFLGSTATQAGTPGSSEQRRIESYREASFYRVIDKDNVDVVTKKNDWAQVPFQTWNLFTDNLNNHYCVNANNVYLVIGNSELNTTKDDEQQSPSTRPTHTNGIVKHNDGYEYLYLYTISASGRNVTSGNLWIPVPDINLDQYEGRLLYKKINAAVLSNIEISYRNPEIPILSDTGAGAVIRLNTVPLSTPSTTESQKRFQIVGIEVVNIGTTEYQDADTRESLTVSMPNETAATVLAIFNAITLGFSNTENFKVRNIVHAKYAMISLIATSNEISTVTDQTEFFSFGVVEDIKDTSGNLAFKTSKPILNNEKIKTNNVKITVGKNGLSAAPTTTEFTPNTQLTLQSKSRFQKGRVASAKAGASDKIISEVQIQDINQYEAGDTVKSAKSSTVFLIDSVIKPTVGAFSGKTLHIGDTTFNTENNTKLKTFVTQVIQRF